MYTLLENTKGKESLAKRYSRIVLVVAAYW